MDYSLYLSSFVAGFLTVLVPCILPVLPVVIGGSLGGGNETKRNPYIIIGSLLLSIILFTLLIQFLSSFFYIPDFVWRYIAAFLVLLVGVTFLFPRVWGSLPGVSHLSVKSNESLGKGFQRPGLVGDVIIGASLGPVFSSCSPTYLLILAVILPASFLEGLSYLVAFVLGLGAVLLLIVLVGQLVIEKLNILADSTGWFKRGIGILMILVALAIIFGLDKELAVVLLDLGFVDITRFEI